MLIIEIKNDGKNKKHPDFGSYDYTVRVNRQVIARGHVDNQPRNKHFSFLLSRIAEHARHEELRQIVGDAEYQRLTTPQKGETVGEIKR